MFTSNRSSWHLLVDNTATSLHCTQHPEPATATQKLLLLHLTGSRARLPALTGAKPGSKRLIHTHSAPTVCRTCSALRLQSASGQLLKLLPHMSNSLSRSCVRRANWNTACHVWHGVVSCWDTADTHAAEVRSWTQKPFCLLCFNLKSGFTQQPTWVQKDFL